MSFAHADRVLIVTLSGEVYTKSAGTRRRFRRVVVENLQAALSRAGQPADVLRLDSGRLAIPSDDPDRDADTARHVFGIQRVERATPVTWHGLADLADAVGASARATVAGRTFAVRVRRHGEHRFGSMDAERVIGARLLPYSSGVDLDHPEVTVTVLVVQDRAWVVDRAWDGPGGLPLGTQEPCLALLSGGFDSPVAAWLIMRRGSPVDFLHLQLRCAQTDHALAVASQLWRRWGTGTSPLAWVIDFAGVERAISTAVPPTYRQVVLKQLMLSAADRLAGQLDVPALVTGESVGQVSSQTLRHLHEIDAVCSRLVLRPLTGLDKHEIIDRARAIGTQELSARAVELCDLSGGQPVAVAARAPELLRARTLALQALDHGPLPRRVVALEHWLPGMDLVPVVDRPPTGAAVVAGGERVPPEGPVVLTGERAVHRATRLAIAGRHVAVQLAATPGTAPASVGPPEPAAAADAS